jgi:CheY-like chemotaxis protein
MSSGRRTVLVVEDDPDTREMYAVALRMGGFDVRCASDGFSALHQLEQEVPAAMVLDLDLPCVSGLDVQDELGAHAETRDVPVVIISGTEWPEASRRAYARLRKPITPEALVKIVRRAMTRQPTH